MSCEQELNAQLRGIQARLSQAENNITNHFVGTSLLCKALLGTPAAAAGAAMSSIYSLGAEGFDLMQKLIEQLNPLDTKKLMMQAAAALEDTMAAELEALVGMVESAMDAAIDAAVGAVDAAIATVEAATIALEDAIAAGIEGPILAATAALNAANSAAKSATSALESLENLKISSSNMLKAQADAAGCKSISLHITS